MRRCQSLAVTALICPRSWYEHVAAARDDITRLMTLESGKPLAESRAEFDNGWAARARGPPHSAAQRARRGAARRDQPAAAAVKALPAPCPALPVLQRGQHRMVC